MKIDIQRYDGGRNVMMGAGAIGLIGDQRRNVHR